MTWNFDQSTIYYDDPTRYHDFNDLLGGWGIGTPDNWYLKEIANIIKILATKIYNYENNNVSFKNLIFYGSSMAGFMSLQLSTLIKNSISIAEIPQFDVIKWKYWPELKKRIFNELNDETIKSNHSYKLNFYDLIIQQNYIPNAYLILDCSNEHDYQNQFKDFFLKLNKLPFKENNNVNKIKIRIDGKNKGHQQLSYQETYELIDNICSTIDKSLKKQNQNFLPFNNSESLDNNILWKTSSNGKVTTNNNYTYFTKSIEVAHTYIPISSVNNKTIEFDLYLKGLRTSPIISLRDGKKTIGQISLKSLKLESNEWNHIKCNLKKYHCIISNDKNDTSSLINIISSNRFYFRLGTEDICLKWKNFKIY